MKSLKAKRIFILIWVILSLSALASIIRLVMGIMMYSNNMSLLTVPFWIAFFKLIVMGILLMMSLSLWKIVKTYTQNNKWQPQYYQKVRQLGYCAIALTIIYSFFQIGLQTLFFQRPANSLIVTDFMRVLTDSPTSWVLSLSIFLFAELLQVANQVKAENESFI